MRTFAAGRQLPSAILLLVLVAACKGREAAPAAAATPPPRLEPQVRLTAPGGQVFDLQNERGNVVLLFFGYTHCPDVCPTTLADFAGVRRRLGMRSDRVRFVFISVDPARDTPDRAQAYARSFDRTFIGLTGDSATLARIQRGFRVASYIEKDSTGEYSVAHSASVFIIGSDGTVQETLRFGGAGVDQLYPVVLEALNAPVPAQLRVVDPWVRTQGDVQSMSAGYFSFENPGSTPVVVRGVSCAHISMVTMHESKDEHGTMRMTPLDSIVVPAGGRIAMAPGGIHLMLMGLARPLNDGEHAECTVRTSSGELHLVAPVRGAR